MPFESTALAAHQTRRPSDTSSGRERPSGGCNQCPIRRQARSGSVEDENVRIGVWKFLELFLIDLAQGCLADRRQLGRRLGEIGVEVLHVPFG